MCTVCNHANRILELENICNENPKLIPYFDGLNDIIEKSIKATLDKILNEKELNEIIKDNPNVRKRLLVLYNIYTPTSPYENPLDNPNNKK